ncbi:MAG: DUF1566 domain-containing protein, partial [Desulfobulbaceae bacterium]|nr:DUF1566 domain-containing protein [Desulfobulbaceae bacterium]
AGGTISLPKTGQTSCYDNGGVKIDCAGTGMNGETQIGEAWPEPRFEANGECVTDNLTGLVWARNANLPNGPMPWQDALNWVTAMNAKGGLCGQTDWRLPNIVELGLLPNKEMADSAAWLNTQGFENVEGYNYWSSTTRANHLEHAWRVQMNFGYWLGSGKLVNAYVWPVRGGEK